MNSTILKIGGNIATADAAKELAKAGVAVKLVWVQDQFVLLELLQALEFLK